MIIAICGFSGSGKSKLARLLAEVFSEEVGEDAVIVRHLHSTAYRIIYSLDAGPGWLHQAKVNDILLDCYGRAALVAPALSAYVRNRSILIIPGAQTQHELQALMDKGAIFVRIERPGFPNSNGNDALSHWKAWDEVIGNVGDLDGLKFQAELLAKKLMNHPNFFALKHELLSRKASQK